MGVYSKLGRGFGLTKRWNLMSIAVVILGCLLGRQVAKPKNLYDAFTVSPQVPTSVIVAKYQLLLKHLQSSSMDGPDPDSLTASAFLKRVYATIGTDSGRLQYHRFGDLMSASGGTVAQIFSKEAAKHRDQIPMLCLVLSLAFSILGYVVSAFCTMQKRFHTARQIIVLYLIGIFCLEIYLRFIDDPSLDSGKTNLLSALPYVRTFLPFERIQVLRRMLPSVVFVAMMWSGWGYVDKDQCELYLLQSVLQTNRVILMRLAREPLRSEQYINRSDILGAGDQQKDDSLMSRFEAHCKEGGGARDGSGTLTDSPSDGGVRNRNESGHIEYGDEPCGQNKSTESVGSAPEAEDGGQADGSGGGFMANFNLRSLAPLVMIVVWVSRQNLLGEWLSAVRITVDRLRSWPITRTLVDLIFSRSSGGGQ